jgi:hypothetical protein
MCTTSVDCKTVMTTMLMIKNSMDPYMISRDTTWYGNCLVWFGLVQLKCCLVGVGVSLSCCLVGAGVSS